MERFPSSNTGGTASRGLDPISSGVLGGIGGLPNSPEMQAAAQIVTGASGIFQTVSGMFDTGKKDREKQQRMLAAENQRHQEEMRKIEEENARASQNRSQIHAGRQESYNKASFDLQRKQLEREKREQELAKRKEQERKNNQEALQRERELCDQRLRAAEEKNQQLMSDTKTSMEADHENFLATKAHMENTHQMEVNMIKGLAGATAYLYKEMGYFNGSPENNGNQNARLQEIEAAPTYQQFDKTQPGESRDEQRPMETSNSPQVPDPEAPTQSHEPNESNLDQIEQPQPTSEPNDDEMNSPDQLAASALPLCDHTSTQKDVVNVHSALYSEEKPFETEPKKECFKCGSSTKMTLCSHFFCPNCHVNDGNVHCPVCQKIF